MRDQPVQHVMRILPDALGDDQRRVAIDARRTPTFLPFGCDETVLLVVLVRMRADRVRNPILRRRRWSARFHLFLRGPAFLVGAEQRRSPLAIS